MLQWNHYTLLHYNSLKERYAYWAKLEHPEKFPMLGLPAPGESMIETWWMNTAAAAEPATPAPPATGTASPAPAEDSGTNWPLILVIAAGVIGAGIVFARRKRQP